MEREKNTAENPVALVTGTSSGFGLLTVLELARRGYVAVATMRDLRNSDELRLKAQEEGLERQIHYLKLDVTNAAEIEHAIAGTLKTYGRIDVLVNNAGFAIGGFTEEIPMEDWRLQFETNFFGLVAVTKAVLPSMRQKGRGCIINVGSISGLVGFPGYAPYAASKFAVEASAKVCVTSCQAPVSRWCWWSLVPSGRQSGTRGFRTSAASLLPLTLPVLRECCAIPESQRKQRRTRFTSPV